jgi:3-oxoacyl-[acyl-carrier-protein] synthase II
MDAEYLLKPAEDGAGLARAIKACLSQAGQDMVDAYYGSGSSIPYEDRAELFALRAAFSGSSPPLTALKSYLGHAC